MNKTKESKAKQGTAAATAAHPTTRPVAYSYLRFSDQEQAHGDSVRRQTKLRDAWIQRNNCTLDTTLRVDAGVSGYGGLNRTDADKYGLADFLRRIERGEVPRGSYLIVENLDRLSREHEVQATHTLTGIC